MNTQQPSLIATAEWCAPSTFAARYGYSPGKLWLGRCPSTGTPLGYVDDRHVCLVSGNRAGKGTTSIINNLCLWPGSIVVLDPKGENATITAARRGQGSEHCEGMGQAVHVLDPFNAAQVDDSLRSRFNPLDALDPNDPITIDEAGRVADAIVVMNPESKDPFWDQSARTMVKGLILHVLTAPQFEGKRNLVTIRRLIARGDHAGIATLKEMGEADLPSAQALLWESVASNTSFDGVMAGIGDTFANMAESSPKQFESVLQVANRNTEFLDSPGMQKCVEASDFRLSDLKTDPNGVSLYLSLPQRYMPEHYRWLRMMITMIIGEMEAIPGQPASGHRVLMMLDEFAGLKRMEVIENAVSQVAGYGLTLFFVLQSLAQLKEVYKEGWETFLSNAALKMFSGIDDQFTRKYISELIGETEVIRDLHAYAENSGWSYQDTWSESESSTSSHSATSSKSWGSFQNKGTSSGGSTGDSWESWPLFLRNTAGVFAGIAGGRGSSRSTNWGTTAGGGSNTGGSDGEAIGGSTGTTHGSGGSDGKSGGETWTKNQTLHKRPLVTTDEIGRYFTRIDEDDDRFSPGCTLVLLSGQPPAVIQKAAYYNDNYFRNLFSEHSDHRGSREIVVLFPEVDFSRAWPVIQNPQINRAFGVSVGQAICRGDKIMRVDLSYAVPENPDEYDSARFDLVSPCNGILSALNDPKEFEPGTELFTITSDDGVQSDIDISIVEKTLVGPLDKIANRHRDVRSSLICLPEPPDSYACTTLLLDPGGWSTWCVLEANERFSRGDIIAKMGDSRREYPIFAPINGRLYIPGRRCSQFGFSGNHYGNPCGICIIPDTPTRLTQDHLEFAFRKITVPKLVRFLRKEPMFVGSKWNANF